MHFRNCYFTFLYSSCSALTLTPHPQPQSPTPNSSTSTSALITTTYTAPASSKPLKWWIGRNPRSPGSSLSLSSSSSSNNSKGELSSIVIRCDATDFGHAHEPSCRDVWTRMPESDERLVFGSRVQGVKADVVLPYRYMSGKFLISWCPWKDSLANPISCLQ